MSVIARFNGCEFKFIQQGEYMKYTIKQLAKEYNKHLNIINVDVKLPQAQPFDISTYNEYNYQKLMQYCNKLYYYTDSFKQTENFLKGD